MTMDREERRGPEGEAMAWFVRLKDPQATEADRAAFRVWLAASPHHRRAYAEAEGLWGRLALPAARLGAGGWYRHSPRRRPGPVLALAAAVLLLVAVAGWRDPGMLDRVRADHATAPGERRAVALADGSRLVLDGDSAVSVTLGESRRTVELLRGRVWVDVVHEEARDFHVRAGTVEAQALGTAFDVDRQTAAVTVTVERGRVAVVPDAHPGSAVVLSAGQRVRVAEGTGAAAPAAAPAAVDESAFAWRRGLIVFDRVPLAEVVATLDRLSSRRVVVADGGIGGMTLSGVFRADDPEAVLDALRRGLGVRTITVPGVVTLIRR